MTSEEAKDAVNFIKDNIPFDVIDDVADIASNFGSKEFQDVCGKISEMAGLENQSAIVMNMISNIIRAEQNSDKSDEYTRNAIANAMELAGTFADFVPLIGPILSDVLDQGAECLVAGTKIVNNYVKQLDEINKAIDNSNPSDVKDTVKNLKDVSNKMANINTMIRNLQTAKVVYGGLGANTDKIDKQINELKTEQQKYNDKANMVIDKINEKMGTDFGDLDELAKGMMTMSDEMFNNAFSARVDPLIFDLQNDGFDVQKEKDGAYFDLNCDGFAEKVNWTSTDAILAIDINGNGIIDDGSEVFGDRHLMRDGTIPKTDYETVSTGIYEPPTSSVGGSSGGGGAKSARAITPQTVEVKHAKSGFVL